MDEKTEIPQEEVQPVQPDSTIIQEQLHPGRARALARREAEGVSPGQPFSRKEILDLASLTDNPNMKAFMGVVADMIDPTLGGHFDEAAVDFAGPGRETPDLGIIDDVGDDDAFSFESPDDEELAAMDRVAARQPEYERAPLPRRSFRPSWLEQQEKEAKPDFNFALGDLETPWPMRESKRRKSRKRRKK